MSITDTVFLNVASFLEVFFGAVAGVDGCVAAVAAVAAVALTDVSSDDGSVIHFDAVGDDGDNATEVPRPCFLPWARKDIICFLYVLVLM